MTKSAVLALFAASFLGITAGTISASASSLYSMQELGSIGSGMASGFTSGQAVGYVIDSEGYQIPAMFSGGQATLLPGTGEANAINGAGLIAGTTYQGNSPSVATWTNGQLTTLGIAGYGTALNDSGQIAGSYINGNVQHGFLWTNGTLTDLGTLGGNWSSAYAVNDSGQIAGTSSINNSGTFHAFFSNGSGMTDLGTLGGRNSYGLGMNSSGSVVGNSQISSGFSNAFLWTGSSMTDLGTLGGNQSYAQAVNDSDAVVGYSWISGNTATHAFLYANGVMMDLNSLLNLGSAWTITAAYGIDDAGQILATATSADGQNYAVELDPIVQQQARILAIQPLSVPEPRNLTFAGFGCLLAGVLFLRAKKA